MPGSRAGTIPLSTPCLSLPCTPRMGKQVSVHRRWSTMSFSSPPPNQDCMRWMPLPDSASGLLGACRRTTLWDQLSPTTPLSLALAAQSTSIRSEHRAACLDVINAYRREHGLVGQLPCPVVLCSPLVVVNGNECVVGERSVLWLLIRQGNSDEHRPDRGACVSYLLR
jgi:hypothetical protein